MSVCCLVSELKLRQSEEGGLRSSRGSQQAAPEQREGTELQQLNNNCNSKPGLEETVNSISNRLKERRRELGLPDSVKVAASDTHTHTC